VVLLSNLGRFLGVAHFDLAYSASGSGFESKFRGLPLMDHLPIVDLSDDVTPPGHRSLLDG
jgi:hypothetical protein